MKKILVCIFLLAIKLSAQDIHFSFFEYSGTNLNPALSGSENFFTARLNYRTQWWSVASPFKTASLGLDFALVKQNRVKARNLSKGWFGAGINVINDVTGNLTFTSNMLALNVAYHQPISVKSVLSAGFYGAYQERSIGGLEGRWPSQYNGSRYDPNLISGETSISQKYSFLDGGFGLAYAFHKYRVKDYGRDNFSFYMGASAYHVNKPKYSFFSNSKDRFGVRTSYYINSIIGLGNDYLSLLPHIMFTNQGKSNELVLGTYLKYMDVSLGLFGRTDDSFIIKGLFEKNDLLIGLGFDMITSSLKNVSRQGAFELCLIYNVTNKARHKGCYTTF